MARARVCFVIGVLAFAAAAHGQDRLNAKVLLGAPTAFEVDLEYHDPGELDLRLQGSRVIPIWMSVKNKSGQTARFDYADIRLDVGGAPGQAPLVPVDATQAREQLRRDGRYNALVKLLASRDRITGEPFSKRLPDGPLRPGQSKSGYVFFFRREGVPFNGFMAISTVAHAPEMLPTATIDVPSPPATATRSADLVAKAINTIAPYSPGAADQGSRIAYGAPPFGESYAILFGISDYDAKTPLPGVGRDVAAMRAYLQTQGFKPAVVKENRSVTGDTLRDVQRHFQGKLTPSDRLLVYYAGHGRLFKDRGYLVLSASRDTFDPRTNIPMDEFVFWMRALPVKHLLVILDACFAGAAVPGTTRSDFDTEHRLGGSDREKLRDLASAGGKFVVMAATDEQRANEDKDGGLFTRALLTSLSERRQEATGRLITTLDAFARARDIVVDEVAKRRLDKQIPVFKDLGTATQGDVPSKGDFLFVRPDTK